MVMSSITDTVMARLEDTGVEVFFVSREATKWWNARRHSRKQAIALLGGWYWTLNGEEAGPFRTPSAARRDVYYRRILQETPPLMDMADLKKAKRDIRKGISLPKSGRRVHSIIAPASLRGHNYGAR
jgi:hypothetical protein